MPADASSDPPDRYHAPLAAAFVRGRLGAVSGEDDAAAIARGLAGGLRLHKFKSQTALPRVRRVLGVLRGLAPATLLDVGSGRGTFLWPLLADPALPALAITAIDSDARRAHDLGAVARGGVARLTAARADLTRLPFADGAFDTTTALEVLEHLPDPERAAREALRVARRHVVVSVPSHEDDNPEHIQRFDARALEGLLQRAGARRVSTEHVLNHVIAVAFVSATTAPVPGP
jgi:ubiquinone/menaquinone biosynthesis C-methylase UbiE